MNIKKLLPLKLSRYLENYQSRTKLRKQLQQMNARELDRLTLDLGIPKADLIQEANRPFWKTCR